MRTFILALAAIVPAFAIERVEAADEIPAFGIARNCNAETAGAAIGGPRPAGVRLSRSMCSRRDPGNCLSRRIDSLYSPKPTVNGMGSS